MVSRQADMLARLHKVTFDCFVGVGEVFSGCGERETGPQRVVPRFDGSKPRGFDGCTRFCVVVLDGAGDAGQIHGTQLMRRWPWVHGTR